MDVSDLVDDTPFRDPASLFVTPDHYVTRLLHASGIGLDELGVRMNASGAISISPDCSARSTMPRSMRS
jgi:glucuronate isomerase